MKRVYGKTGIKGHKDLIREQVQMEGIRDELEKEYKASFFKVDPIEIDNTQFQPRSSIDEKKLQELMESIRLSQGNIEPVTLIRRDDKLITLAGHRRVEVSDRLNFSVNARIIEAEISDEECWSIAYATNVKEDMAISDQIKAVHKLKGFGLSYREVAEKIGASKTTVERYFNCPPGGQLVFENYLGKTCFYDNCGGE